MPRRPGPPSVRVGGEKRDQPVLQVGDVAGIALVASMALNLARGETFIAVFNAAVAFAIAAIPVGQPPRGPGGCHPSRPPPPPGR